MYLQFSTSYTCRSVTNVKGNVKATLQKTLLPACRTVPKLRFAVASYRILQTPHEFLSRWGPGEISTPKGWRSAKGLSACSFACQGCGHTHIVKHTRRSRSDQTDQTTWIPAVAGFFSTRFMAPPPGHGGRLMALGSRNGNWNWKEAQGFVIYKLWTVHLPTAAFCEMPC